MAESKPPMTEREVKVPWKMEMSGTVNPPQDKKETIAQIGQNILERAKDGVDAIAQAIHEKKESPTSQGSSLTQKGETPKVEPREENKGKLESFVKKAKEEIHEIIDSGRDKTPKVEPQPVKSDVPSEIKGKGLHVPERAREELKATLHKEKPSSDQQQHHKETHGQSGFAENTPVDTIKGPSVIEKQRKNLRPLLPQLSSPRNNQLQRVVLHLRRKIDANALSQKACKKFVLLGLSRRTTNGQGVNVLISCWLLLCENVRISILVCGVVLTESGTSVLWVCEN
ncbi:hypothetical protein Ancab_017965 [Ancistrocladus abbreviatus]